ncbi:hypothetical protein AB4450_12030 [Vibrio breoganii]
MDKFGLSSRFITYVFASKIFYCLFAIFIYSRFTQLGDSESYINGYYLYRNDYTSPAFLLSLIGDKLGYIGSSLFSTIFATIGVLYPLSKARLSIKKQYFILLFCLFPSFGVWTSIISKEIFVLFSMGVCVGGLIDMINNKSSRLTLFQLVCLLMLTALKPHYSLAIYLSFVVIYLHQRGLSGLLTIVATIICTYSAIILAVYFSDRIFNYVTFIADNYFVDGASTRPNDFWLESSDFYTYSLIGVPKAFIGPTLMESLNRSFFFPFFIEGLILFTTVVFYTFAAAFNRKKVNIISFCMMFTFVLILFFAHYPVGILNPGSSIRYRSGMIMPLMTFVFYLYEYSVGNSIVGTKSNFEKNNIY